MVWEHPADDHSTRGAAERPMIDSLPDVVTEIAVVGAHCDDIAIGMGATLLTMSRQWVRASRARTGAVRRWHRACGRGAGRAERRSVPGRRRGHRPRHTGRSGAGTLGTNQESPREISADPATPRSGIRSATPRRSSRSSAACRIVADRVSRSSPTRVRDSQMGDRHSAPDDLSSARNRCGGGEGDACYLSTIRRRRATTGSTNSRFSGCARLRGVQCRNPLRGSFRRGEGDDDSQAGLIAMRTRQRKGVVMRVLAARHQGYMGTVKVPILQAEGHGVAGLDSGSSSWISDVHFGAWQEEWTSMRVLVTGTRVPRLPPRADTAGRGSRGDRPRHRLLQVRLALQRCRSDATHDRQGHPQRRDRRPARLRRHRAHGRAEQRPDRRSDRRGHVRRQPQGHRAPGASVPRRPGSSGSSTCRRAASTASPTGPSTSAVRSTR